VVALSLVATPRSEVAVASVEDNSGVIAALVGPQFWYPSDGANLRLSKSSAGTAFLTLSAPLRRGTGNAEVWRSDSLVNGGRYWARTSDPWLVDAAMEAVATRADEMTWRGDAVRRRSQAFSLSRAKSRGIVPVWTVRVDVHPTNQGERHAKRSDAPNRWTGIERQRLPRTQRGRGLQPQNTITTHNASPPPAHPSQRLERRGLRVPTSTGDGEDLGSKPLPPLR
jgi:hypothetical protein